jgi:hypothetical protein
LNLKCLNIDSEKLEDGETKSQIKNVGAQIVSELAKFDSAIEEIKAQAREISNMNFERTQELNKKFNMDSKGCQVSIDPSMYLSKQI